MDQALDWYPPGRVSRDFLLSNAFICGIMGPIGSGKSTTAVMKILRHAQTQPITSDGVRRSRYAIVRNTNPQLHTTTIPTWHQWVPKHKGRWVNQGPPTHHIIERMADGTMLDMEVWFVALDTPADVAKVLSMELTAAWVNEAREVPKAIIDGLSGRVGRFKPNPGTEKDLWAANPQIIMDTNPPEDDHWWYILAEKDDSTEEGRDILMSMMEAEVELRRLGLLADNKSLFEFYRQPGAYEKGAENLENLSPGYYAKARAGKGEDWIRVYIDSQYGFVKEGKPVFPEFRDSMHVRDIKPIPGLPIRIGLDFGFWPAAIFGQRTQRGQWRILSEVCASDMGTYRFAEEIKRHIADNYPGFKVAQITGDPAGDARSASDKQERSTFQILKAEGIHASPADSNDFIKRHTAVVGPLSRLIDGEPGMIISPACKILRKGMAGGYAYKKLRVSGSDRYQDKPDKNKYCVPEDYEALTPDGWKTCDQILAGQSVYGYDLSTGRLVESPAHKVNVFDGPHEVIKYKNAYAEWVCTAEHRNVVSSKYGGIKVVTGAELNSSHALIGPTSVNEPRKKCLFSRDFVAIAGWVMSEGSYRKDGSIILSQSHEVNPRYVEYLESILGTPAKDSRNSYWRITKDWAYLLRHLMPNSVPTPEFITKMNNWQRRLFLYEFFRGDGNVSNGKADTYMPDKDAITRKRDFFVTDQSHRCYQKDRAAVDALQMIASMSGYSTYLNEGNHLTILKSNTAFHLRKNCREDGIYQGRVWCPTTGTGTWICRANGRVFVTGNSHPADGLQYLCLGGGEFKNIVKTGDRKPVRVRRHVMFDPGAGF